MSKNITMVEDDNGLARRAIKCFIKQRTDEFSLIAKSVKQECQLKESIKNGLLQIVKAEQSFEDIQTRVAGLNVMAILGLTKAPDVHRELCNLFTKSFDECELHELAVFEALPKTKRCGLLCSRINLLQNLLQSLLHLSEDRGLAIGEHVAEIFSGTRFGGKVVQWIQNGREITQ